MKFSLSNEAPERVETPCLVIGVVEDTPLTGAARELDEAMDGLLGRMVSDGDIDDARGYATMLHRPQGIAAERLLVIGFGSADKLDRARFERSCMDAGKHLRDHPVKSAHFCLADVELDGTDRAWRLRQEALAVHRANYLYSATKKQREHAPVPLESASFRGDESNAQALEQARCMAAGFLRARELGNLPSNLCTPIYLAGQAQEIAARHDSVEVEILDPEAMAELGMNALLAVGQGSANPPRLIVLKHHGADKDQAPVVLVGKGITFDTGGISLKPAENMDQMKFDMCGAAGVLGAFEACAELNLPINLVTIVAAAENMPDGRAYRPGDVLTSMSGQTIEVLNTDAEGRLVLCDALTYAERFTPRALIDVATLTGACVVALGHHASGLMSKHQDLVDELLEAGTQTVDRAWPLPIWDDYQVQLKTPFADMKNVGGMPAGAITAGCFLSRFAKDQRWAHLDIAGSAWKWGEKEGATGRPVGLLTQFVINQCA
ncbi:MAG: leucyl aminopeptidase [Xanthomonadales bacterium]|nr:leucyl aminopeptidase [Xanthomonadales bacterium]